MREPEEFYSGPVWRPADILTTSASTEIGVVLRWDGNAWVKRQPGDPRRPRDEGPTWREKKLGEKRERKAQRRWNE